MGYLPPAIDKLIEALGELPGVGPRTAERYAYYLLKRSPEIAKRIANNLSEIHSKIAYCRRTFAFVEAGQELSDLYTDPGRDKKVVAVVAEPFDIVSIEKTGLYKGTYHVLGGLVSPIDGITPESLHIKELLSRISEDGVDEVILALNASIEGETTALYLQKMINEKQLDVKISRLARGLPVGLDLEYADQITLGRALEGRQVIE